MTAVLLVAAGGAAGATVRYALVRLVPGRFPWGVLIANVLGSFLLGLLVVGVDDDLGLLAGVGFCGALTTFSTFALDTLLLAREGRPTASWSNVLVSVAGCMVALACGLALARAVGLGA